MIGAIPPHVSINKLSINPAIAIKKPFILFKTLLSFIFPPYSQNIFNKYYIMCLFLVYFIYNIYYIIKVLKLKIYLKGRFKVEMFNEKFLCEKEFVVLDIETTELYTKGGRIIEIGLELKLKMDKL